MKTEEKINTKFDFKNKFRYLLCFNNNEIEPFQIQSVEIEKGKITVEYKEYTVNHTIGKVLNSLTSGHIFSTGARLKILNDTGEHVDGFMFKNLKVTNMKRLKFDYADDSKIEMGVEFSYS